MLKENEPNGLIVVRKCCAICRYKLDKENCPLYSTIKSAEDCGEYDYTASAVFKVVCNKFEIEPLIALCSNETKWNGDKPHPRQESYRFIKKCFIPEFDPNKSIESYEGQLHKDNEKSL